MNDGSLTGLDWTGPDTCNGPHPTTKKKNKKTHTPTPKMEKMNLQPQKYIYYNICTNFLGFSELLL